MVELYCLAMGLDDAIAAERERLARAREQEKLRVAAARHAVDAWALRMQRSTDELANEFVSKAASQLEPVAAGFWKERPSNFWGPARPRIWSPIGLSGWPIGYQLAVLENGQMVHSLFKKDREYSSVHGHFGRGPDASLALNVTNRTQDGQQYNALDDRYLLRPATFADTEVPPEVFYRSAPAEFSSQQVFLESQTRGELEEVWARVFATVLVHGY